MEMGAQFNRWTLLKLVELILVLICLTFKRVTDDEASRVFLYLQKISREWSLLNNITWSRLGAAVADATYGGYLIITAALFIGHCSGELPTRQRVVEYIVLGLGTVLFVVLGSLSFAALDSVPHDLVDNAAIVGTVSLVTAGLFLLDMGGPRASKTAKVPPSPKKSPKSALPKSVTQQVFDIEKEIETSEKTHFDTMDPKIRGAEERSGNGFRGGVKRNGISGNGISIEMDRRSSKGYVQMKDDVPRRFGIYGKDMVDEGGNETDDTDVQLPPEMEPHSPVWSNIRKGRLGKFDIVSPHIVPPRQKDPEEYEEGRPPSRPGDPGFVQYVAQHWGESGAKTPRHSPTQV